MRLAETTSPGGALWAVSGCEAWRYGQLFLLLIAGIVLAKGERYFILRVGTELLSKWHVPRRNVSKRYAHVL